MGMPSERRTGGAVGRPAHQDGVKARAPRRRDACDVAEARLTANRASTMASDRQPGPIPTPCSRAMRREEARARARQAQDLLRRLGRRRQDLRDARRRARRAGDAGRDVVVGVVETHGRAETAALLQGLELLPRRRSRTAARRSASSTSTPRSRAGPTLILVDELAHANAPGSRHPKRWQDVDELLAAGIDVYTTLNVQHLESLNDVVGGITGIRVLETVPDTFFDTADEIVLVDMPADELLARLKAGKVYCRTQAERAAAQLLPQGQPDRAARDRAAPHRRRGRGRGAGLSRRQVDRAACGRPQARLLCCIGPSPAPSTSCAAPRASPRSSASLDRGLRRDAAAAAPARRSARAHPAGREARARSWARAPRSSPARRAEALVEYARAQNIVDRRRRAAPGERLARWRRTLSDALAGGAGRST